MNELEKLNQLQLKPHSSEPSFRDAIRFDEMLPNGGAAKSTVIHPVGSHLQGTKLMVRYELFISYTTGDGQNVSTLVPPGTVVPVFRKVQKQWRQVLQCVELRAYAAPFHNGELFVMGDENIFYQDLDTLLSRPASEDLILSKPGGGFRLRPHPKVPGMLPMKHTGKGRLLERNPWQAGDYMKIFGKMPLLPISKAEEFPFRFVSVNLTGEDQVEGFTPLTADADTTSASILTKGYVGNVQPLDLPVSMAYAEELFGDQFTAMAYEGGVLDYLDDQEFVFLQHRLSPYTDNDAVDLSYIHSDQIFQPFGREQLPPAVFLMDFAPPKNKDQYFAGLTPYAYDSARKFKGGQYDPVGT